MPKLKSNIVFNFLGIAWLGMLTIAVTPIQVHYLGVEAFGFVGLITILQVLLGSLDLGISATVTKIISSDHSDQRSASADAVNTASGAYWVIALLILALLWSNSEKVAVFWLSRTHLDPNTVTLGIKIISVYLCLRWPVAFYSGIITGLQRLDVLNVLKVGVQTLRLVGGVVVLFYEPDLVAFLVWFAISSVIELLSYAVLAYRLFPALRLTPYFSLAALRSIWEYSAVMNLIAITALLLGQADRLVVMKFLSLEALGYYSIAYNASIVISLVQTAINGATFPAYSHSFSSGKHTDLMSRYSKASQLMGSVVALPCFVLVFFGYEILQFWINPKVANEAFLPMAWLSIGFFLNALVSNAYMAAVSCGQPNLPLKINLLALVLYVPSLFWLLGHYGISGAAGAYAGLNAYYLVTLMPLVQVKVLKQGIGIWLRANLLPFVLVGVGSFGGAKILALSVQSGWQTMAALALGVMLYAVAAWFSLANALRVDISNMMKKVLPI